MLLEDFGNGLCASTALAPPEAPCVRCAQPEIATAARARVRIRRFIFISFSEKWVSCR